MFPLTTDANIRSETQTKIRILKVSPLKRGINFPPFWVAWNKRTGIVGIQ